MNNFEFQIISYEEYLINKRMINKRLHSNATGEYHRYFIIDKDTLNVICATSIKSEIKLKLDLLNLILDFKRSFKLGISPKSYYLFIPLKEKEN